MLITFLFLDQNDWNIISIIGIHEYKNGIKLFCIKCYMLKCKLYFCILYRKAQAPAAFSAWSHMTDLRSADEGKTSSVIKKKYTSTCYRKIINSDVLWGSTVA